MRSLERLTLVHLWVAFGAFTGACFFGVWQMWARSPLQAPFVTPDHYFLSVTTHGVDGGLGGESEETALFLPVMRQVRW